MTSSVEFVLKRLRDRQQLTKVVGEIVYQDIEKAIANNPKWTHEKRSVFLRNVQKNIDYAVRTNDADGALLKVVEDMLKHQEEDGPTGPAFPTAFVQPQFPINPDGSSIGDTQNPRKKQEEEEELRGLQEELARLDAAAVAGVGGQPSSKIPATPGQSGSSQVYRTD